MWLGILYYFELALLKEVYDLAGLTTLFWAGAILGLTSLALKGRH